MRGSESEKRAFRPIFPLVIAAILATTFSAYAEDKAQNDCATAAFKDYIASGLTLNQADPSVSSVATIIGKRRLTEAFCLRFVQCMNVPALGFAAMFAKCVDDEDEERRNLTK